MDRVWIGFRNNALIVLLDHFLYRAKILLLLFDYKKTLCVSANCLGKMGFLNIQQQHRYNLLLLAISILFYDIHT